MHSVLIIHYEDEETNEWKNFGLKWDTLIANLLCKFFLPISDIKTSTCLSCTHRMKKKKGFFLQKQMYNQQHFFSKIHIVSIQALLSYFFC